jgi:hypothetical protein
VKRRKRRPHMVDGIVISTMQSPLAKTHPFLPTPAPALDRLKEPLPVEQPPASYWTTAANSVGMQFHALVIPLPIRAYPLSSEKPDREAVADALEALAATLRGE